MFSAIGMKKCATCSYNHCSILEPDITAGLRNGSSRKVSLDSIMSCIMGGWLGYDSWVNVLCRASEKYPKNEWRCESVSNIRIWTRLPQWLKFAGSISGIHTIGWNCKNVSRTGGSELSSQRSSLSARLALQNAFWPSWQALYTLVDRLCSTYNY